MVSLAALITLVVWLLIAGTIYWLGLWLVGQVGPPEPFNKLIRIVLAVVVFFIVLNALLVLAGYPLVDIRRY